MSFFLERLTQQILNLEYYANLLDQLQHKTTNFPVSSGRKKRFSTIMYLSQIGDFLAKQSLVKIAVVWTWATV